MTLTFTMMCQILYVPNANAYFLLATIIILCRIYGRTVNPYHPGRICGGSSGGEGSIIASGASIFGIGSDVGGRYDLWTVLLLRNFFNEMKMT